MEAVFSTLAATLFVCALAVIVIKIWARRASPDNRRLKMLERLALDGRHAVYLVEVGGKTLVVGSSESGMSLLTELTAYDLGREVTDQIRMPASEKRIFGLSRGAR